MKLRVLISDDEPLSRQRLRRFLRVEPDTELVAECVSGLEVVDAVRQKSPDVAFLDVKMPELDAFGALEALNSSRLPAVIFVTAHDEFAVRAFEANAVDYLLKPFDRSRFQTALGRARHRLQHACSDRNASWLMKLLNTIDAQSKVLQRLTVKTDGRIAFVKTAEIDWASAADNYIELHVGNKTHLLRTTLTALATQLPQNQFVQVARSTLINLERVKEIHLKPHGDYRIVLHNGISLSGSRSYRQALTRLLGKSQ